MQSFSFEGEVTWKKSQNVRMATYAFPVDYGSESILTFKPTIHQDMES